MGLASKINTKLDFKVMSNPFNVKTLTESEAIKRIKAQGFRIKRVKVYRKTVAIKPIGDEDLIYNFIERLIDERINVFDGGIAIKKETK